MSNDLIAYLFWLLITVAIIAKIDKRFGLGKMLSFIFLILGLLFLYGGISTIQESFYQNKNYVATTCRITQQIPEEIAQPDKKGSTDGIYCPVLILTHDINNKLTTSKTKLSCVSKASDQTAMLAVYGVGTEIPCWYDQQNVTTASIVRPETFAEALLSKALLIGILLLTWVAYRNRYPRTIVKPTPAAPKTTSTVPLDSKTTQATPTLAKNEILNTLSSQNKISFKWVDTNSSSSNKKITLPNLILILFVIGIMCAIQIFFVIVPEWRAHYSYQTTTCTILETQMNRTTSDDKVIYKPLLHVSYVINGATYSSWAPISYNYSAQENQARSALNAYQVNNSYPCRYDPKNYSNVVMTKGRMSFLVFFSLLLCITVASAFVYGFIQDKRKESDDSEP